MNDVCVRVTAKFSCRNCGSMVSLDKVPKEGDKERCPVCEELHRIELVELLEGM